LYIIYLKLFIKILTPKINKKKTLNLFFYIIFAPLNLKNIIKMKKLIVMAAFAVAGLVNAQTGFKAGVHAGLPIGDAAEYTKFNVGLDASYMFDVAEGFKVGATAGYTVFTGKEQTLSAFGITIKNEAQNINFFTIGGTAQYSFSESIFGGLDLGYAIPNKGNGAIYFLPKVGYQTEQFEVYAGYRHMSYDVSAIGAVLVGFNYKF
jgi:hypothetical protein